MNTYIFKSKSTKKNNNSSYIDKMNEAFLKKIFKVAPYLKDNNQNKEVKNSTTEYIFINKKKKPTTVLDEISLFDSLKFLSDTNEKDNYDFTLDDGTRVTIYDDEIQIGYDFYPKYYFDNADFISSLSNETKNHILEIYVKIKLS